MTLLINAIKNRTWKFELWPRGVSSAIHHLPETICCMWEVRIIKTLPQRHNNATIRQNQNIYDLMWGNQQKIYDNFPVKRMVAFSQKHHNSLSGCRQSGTTQMICSQWRLMGLDSCYSDVIGGIHHCRLSFLSPVPWHRLDVWATKSVLVPTYSGRLMQVYNIMLNCDHSHFHLRLLVQLYTRIATCWSPPPCLLLHPPACPPKLLWVIDGNCQTMLSTWYTSLPLSPTPVSNTLAR